MHNFNANFAKILDVCKLFGKKLINEQGNISRRGTKPKFSDIEVVALSLTAEAMSIDSENHLFRQLKHCNSEISNLISRRQYNDRRRALRNLYNEIQKQISVAIDNGEDIFCVDSKPIAVCKIARAKRCQLGKSDYDTAPSFGYCAAQKTYYYGYKLHTVCGANGIIHSFELTKANVHDINYLKNIKCDFSNCTMIGDRGYLNASMQLDLFESANIRLEVPYRLNQKNWKPAYRPFAKIRKRIETIFSQLCDQFMLCRNYAKNSAGLFTRIISKISAYSVLQYINFINNKPIGQVKNALF